MGGMGPSGQQGPSLLLVVGGGSRGVLILCVQHSVSFLFGRFIHVTICVYSNRHCISSWLGYDDFHAYRSVIPYVYVDSAHRSLNRGLLRLGHDDRSSPRWEAWRSMGRRSRACCSWWQEGVEVCFSRLCKIRHLFSQRNPFMSRFVLSVTIVVFPYDIIWLGYDICHMCDSVIPNVYLDSSYCM